LLTNFQLVPLQLGEEGSRAEAGPGDTRVGVIDDGNQHRAFGRSVFSFFFFFVCGGGGRRVLFLIAPF
jgi:hypothetical protein